MNFLCRLGFHAYGEDYWGIRVCEREDCDKIDKYHGFWGKLRHNSEHNGAPKLSDSSARRHWNERKSICKDVKDVQS